MSNTFYFDYDIFHNYYTETSHLEKDKKFSKKIFGIMFLLNVGNQLKRNYLKNT